MDLTTLTVSAVLAEAERLLRGGGYKVAKGTHGLALQGERALLAEDKYGVVAIVAYETWGALTRGWTHAQGALVDAMSQRLSRSEPKAWDGYLVCLTPAPIGFQDEEIADEIRRNTRRIRKLLATGQDLQTLKDVERVLLPLMPLEPEEIEAETDLFVRLPEILKDRGIELDVSIELLEAFKKHEPLLERLYKHLSER
jgi:hypothetical protein